MQYRFDEFEVDTDRFELCRDGAVQAVEPLVFDLIVFFVRNANRVVGRDEIVETVWGGRAVSDATISSCVKSARRALGDSGDSQSYVRTVRGRGFEFQVRFADVGLEPAAASAPPTGVTRMSVVAEPLEDPKPVLVVVPFTNQSAEADEYFADGLTELVDLCGAHPVFEEMYARVRVV